MSKYQIGEAIKRLRVQRGLTQQELAYPNLDRGHLSNIERGKTIPKKETIKMLFEKLGYDPNLTMDFFLDEKEVELQSTMDKIESFLKRRKTQEANTLVVQLEKNNEFMKNPFHKQRLFYFKAGIILYRDKDFSKVKEFLNEAIKITTPKFKEENIPEYLLSKTDIAIINAFAVVYGEENRLDEAINIIYKLKDSFDSRFMDNESKGRYYPMIIENLTRYLRKAKRYDEAIKMCDVGIRFCIDGSHMRLMPRIISSKAYCLYELGNKEECKKLLRQAYYTYEMCEQFSLMENIKNYVRERPDIDFFKG